VDTNILPIAEKLKLDVHIGQLSDLPVHNGNYDYIMAQQVLEHEPDPKRLLLEMKERLSDNGQIILSFPNVGAFYRFIFRRRWLHWHPPYHINHFSRKSIFALAEQCGLKVRKIKTITPNEWMTYQIRTIREQPLLGKRDTFWDPGIPNTQPGTACKKMLPEKAARLIRSYGFRPAVCVANRLLDSIGAGESFIVFLSR
jgi:SAM-dependent methyltransferase